MWAATAEELLDALEKADTDYLPVVKKPKQKAVWTERDLLEALRCCRDQELGIEEASLIYGVPKRALRSRLRDKNFSLIDDKYKNLMRSRFSLTPVDVRRLAYELVSERYQLSDLPKEKDCLLGNSWYKTFTEKYPHIESGFSLAGNGVCASHNFYNTLEEMISENQIDQDRIFCVDGIELKFRASNAYDFDKIYHRRKVIYTDAKAICCISAAGDFTPPVFIKPQDKEPNNSEGQGVAAEEDADGAALNSTSSSSEFQSAYNKMKSFCDGDSGVLPTAEEVASIKTQIKAHLNKKHPMSEENEEELREKLYEQFNKLRNKIITKYEKSLNTITNDIFHEWLTEFVEHAKPSRQRKVLLLLEEQNQAKSLRTLLLANAHGIIFLVLPPHSVHKIYPLDGFTMSLNRNLSTCASVWLGHNPEFKIQEVPLQELFNKAYMATANPSIARNGFIYSGIWPVNRTIFASTELGGESFLLRSRVAVSSSSAASPCPKVATSARPSDNPQSLRTVEGPVSVEEDNAIDINKLCRVCMKEKMYMKPLFDSTSVNYHGKKISDIVGRTISPDDGLPQLICQYCLVQLMDTVKIKNVVAESNVKMTKLRDTVDGFLFIGDESDKILLSEFQYHDMKLKQMEKFASKMFEINSVCRICLEENPLMTSIFCPIQGSSTACSDFSVRISEVSNCQVHDKDGMSSLICAFCRASINKAWEFTRKVIESEKRFQEILSGEQTDGL